MSEAASVQQLPRKLHRDRPRSVHAGADWLERKGGKLSPLGRKVADIVGAAYRGLYHMELGDVAASRWSDPDCVVVRVTRGLSSYDSETLTIILVLAVDAGLRLEIRPRSNWTLELMFHNGSATILGAVPSMEELVERARAVAWIGDAEIEALRHGGSQIDEVCR